MVVYRGPEAKRRRKASFEDMGQAGIAPLVKHFSLYIIKKLSFPYAVSPLVTTSRVC
jgi:hypothetical protein